MEASFLSGGEVGPSNSGKSTYWFIIRGDEDILQKLDQEWDQVQMQIGWKLENCYRPVTVPSQQLQTHDEDRQMIGDDEKVPAPLQNKTTESPKRLSPAKKPLQNGEPNANKLPGGDEELLEARACSLSPVTAEQGPSTPIASQD